MDKLRYDVVTILENSRYYSKTDILGQLEIIDQIKDYAAHKMAKLAKELFREDIIKQIIQINPLTLEYVKPELQSFDICMKAVMGNAFALEYVRNNEIINNYELYLELCLASVKRFDHSINFITRKDILIEVVRRIPDAINKIYRHTLIEDIYQFALLKKPQLIKKMNMHSPLYLEMCMFIVKLNGLNLELIDPECRTFDICLAATKQNKDAIQFVDPIFKNRIMNDITVLGKLFSEMNINNDDELFGL